MAENNEIVVYTKDSLPAEKRAEVVKMKAELKFDDSNSIISFGAAAQSKTTGFVETVLSTTKNKDAGEAGELLGNLMSNLEKFDADTSNDGFFAKLFSSAKSRLNKIAASYQSVEANIDKIVDQLEKHRMQLMQNTAMLDKLYDKNVDYVNELNLYIIAGEEKLAELNDSMLPALKEKSALDQLSAQQYRDMMDTADRLDKKIHDLKLTRTVSLQSLPQIRLQQSGNNVLVDKIHSSIVNAIPLWKSQLVIALGLAQTNEALKAQREVSETTNRLLRQNSEMLKTTTIETARESERAIVDIETITKANEDIITTIKQVTTIQQESRAKRQEAEQELKRLESELKANIIQALESK